MCFCSSNACRRLVRPFLSGRCAGPGLAPWHRPPPDHCACYPCAISWRPPSSSQYSTFRNRTGTGTGTGAPQTLLNLVDCLSSGEQHPSPDHRPCPASGAPHDLGGNHLRLSLHALHAPAGSGTSPAFAAIDWILNAPR
jgi:hypothetical protein